MKLVDSITNYPRAAIEGFMRRVESIMKTIEEADQVLIKEFEEASPPKEGDNVYHVNFTTFTEYARTQGQPTTIPELLDYYEKWTDTFWELANANIGQYRNPKIVGHVLTHRKVIETLGNFFGQK